ncbi:MAG: lytic murein transglycosylase [Gammaproteobacteria bacterium]|nr:lytic murein transglycosylase [Gammaproteobacteria bacterium]
MKKLLSLLFIVVLTAPLYAHANHKEAFDTHHLEEQTPTFEAWLEAFKREAIVKGIRRETVERALAHVKQIKRVVKLDRNQPEFKLTFNQYLNNVAPPFRVNKGKKLLKQHYKLLDEIEHRYGVQKRFIVALWGMETDFGRLTGGFNVLDALATLAYDSRRSKFFRSQLLKALRIIDAGNIEPEKMTGSWAGAMGQTQFMPSTFLAYAVDFNGNGKIDIWNETGDALASGANYLSKVGWDAKQTWGREVHLPADFDKSMANLDVKKSLAEWQALGVRRANGKNLPKVDIQGSVIILDDGAGPAYMVYDNFRAIMDWNKSENFATSVGILSDRIGY